MKIRILDASTRNLLQENVKDELPGPLRPRTIPSLTNMPCR